MSSSFDSATADLTRLGGRTGLVGGNTRFLRFLSGGSSNFSSTSCPITVGSSSILTRFVGRRLLSASNLRFDVREVIILGDWSKMGRVVAACDVVAALDDFFVLARVVPALGDFFAVFFVRPRVGAGLGDFFVLGRVVPTLGDFFAVFFGVFFLVLRELFFRCFFCSLLAVFFTCLRIASSVLRTMSGFPKARSISYRGQHIPFQLWGPEQQTLFTISYTSISR